MIKVKEHRGELFLETDRSVDSLTDYNGVTSYVPLMESDMMPMILSLINKLSQNDRDTLSFELWTETMDRGLKGITQ